jgi:chromosome segregation ATPase
MELPQENLNIFNSIISDIQGVQSRYDGMMKLMTKRVAKSQQEIQRLHELAQSLEQENKRQKKQLENIHEETGRIRAHNDELNHTNSHLHDELETARQKIQALANTIESLEEEKRDFAKVSHVVALEKENAKLRQEIEALRKTLNECNKSEDDSISIYEKKIKGKIYYINTNDDKTVYEKNDDGSVGKIVGTLDRQGGKTKIVWIEQ